MKCKICNSYIKAQEFLNLEVCSVICYGRIEERIRINKLIDEVLGYNPVIRDKLKTKISGK